MLIYELKVIISLPFKRMNVRGSLLAHLLVLGIDGQDFLCDLQLEGGHVPRMVALVVYDFVLGFYFRGQVFYA